MESNKNNKKEKPDRKDKSGKTDLNSIVTDCARIYRFCGGLQAAPEEMLAFFAKIDNPERSETAEGLAVLILSAAREIRRLIQEEKTVRLKISSRDAVDLAGTLYEIAMTQMPLSEQEDLIREITFYYLLTEKSEKFLEWSRRLLELVQPNNEEYRATLFAIGLAQIFMGEPTFAEIAFHRLLLTAAQATEGYFGLALVYLKLNDPQEVDEMLKHLDVSAPELAEVIRRLAQQPDFTVEDYARETKFLENWELH